MTKREALAVITTFAHAYADRLAPVSREVVMDAVRVLDETCAACGADMYTIIPAHHHTEEGKDVTRNASLR